MKTSTKPRNPTHSGHQTYRNARGLAMVKHTASGKHNCSLCGSKITCHERHYFHRYRAEWHHAVCGLEQGFAELGGALL